MPDGNCNIVGIGRTEEEAALRPKAVLEASISEIATETCGKIFVGLEVINEGPVMIGLQVDGKEAKIADNQKHMGTSLVKTPGRFEAYAIDLPMRIIGDEKTGPGDHSIRVCVGHMKEGGVVWKTGQNFTLRITGAAPKVKYDPKKDGD